MKHRVREAHRDMAQATTHPLGHSLRLLGSQLIDLGQRSCNNLAGSTNDRVLAQQSKQTPLGFDSLIESYLKPALDISATRRQHDHMLAVTLKSSARPPRRNRSRSPVHRTYLLRVRQHARYSYQPTRQENRGSSRGSRGEQRSSDNSNDNIDQAIFLAAGNSLFRDTSHRRMQS